MLHMHSDAVYISEWAEQPPKVMRRSQRRNNLQICPRRDSNTGGSDPQAILHISHTTDKGSFKFDFQHSAVYSQFDYLISFIIAYTMERNYCYFYFHYRVTDSYGFLFLLNSRTNKKKSWQIHMIIANYNLFTNIHKKRRNIHLIRLSYDVTKHVEQFFYHRRLLHIWTTGTWSSWFDALSVHRYLYQCTR